MIYWFYLYKVLVLLVTIIQPTAIGVSDEMREPYVPAELHALMVWVNQNDRKG